MKRAMTQTTTANAALVRMVIGSSCIEALESIVTQKMIAIVTAGAVQRFFHVEMALANRAAAPAKTTAPKTASAISMSAGSGRKTESGTAMSPTDAIDGNA